MTVAKPTAWELLRAEFPPEQIGKLPKAGITLSYVGHAAVTDRLLQVDPQWTWEPFSQDGFGNPVLIVNEGGMPGEPWGLWIKLTVFGVTRPGFGGGKNAKECISDAIRNAAMRFGVALDLWAKEDLHGNGAAAAPAASAPREPLSSPDGASGPSTFKQPGPRGSKPDAETQKLRDELIGLAGAEAEKEAARAWIESNAKARDAAGHKQSLQKAIAAVRDKAKS